MVAAILGSGLFWVFYCLRLQIAYGKCTGIYQLLVDLDFFRFLPFVISYWAIHVGVSGMMIRGREDRHCYDLQALAGILLGCAVLLYPFFAMLQTNLPETAVAPGFREYLIGLTSVWGLPLMIYAGATGAFKSAQGKMSGFSLILLVLCVILAMAGLIMNYVFWKGGHVMDCFRMG